MISRKKIFYPVSEPLHHYLRLYHQESKLPVSYDDLQYYAEAIPLLDKFGKDTLWETVIYPQSEINRVHDNLKIVYAKLKAAGDLKALKHLYIERIDSKGAFGRLLDLKVSDDGKTVVQFALAFTQEGQWRNLRENPELYTALLPKDVRSAGTCNIQPSADLNTVSYSCSGSEPETFRRK